MAFFFSRCRNGWILRLSGRMGAMTNRGCFEGWLSCWICFSIPLNSCRFRNKFGMTSSCLCFWETSFSFTRKMNYLSKDVEENQSLNNQTTLQRINTFPTTTNKSIPSGRSSLMNIRTNFVNNQSPTDTIESETLIPISQINQYSSK